MNSGIKLINLPWTYSRQDLVRYLNRTLGTRVRFARILFDKTTGLSRGIGLARLENEQIAKDIIRRGVLDVEGRSVIVLENVDPNNNAQKQAEQ